MGIYRCKSETKINDIVECVADPHGPEFPGTKGCFYRVTWMKGVGGSVSNDIELDGHKRDGCPPSSSRFRLYARNGVKAPSPAMPPFKQGEIVIDKSNRADEYLVMSCFLDEGCDWRINIIGQQGGKPCRNGELASRYDVKPPAPKFKAGDIVIKRGGDDSRYLVNRVQSYDSARGCYYVFVTTSSGGHCCGQDQDYYELAAPLAPRFAEGDFVQVKAAVCESSSVYKITGISVGDFVIKYHLSSIKTVNLGMGWYDEDHLKKADIHGITDPCTFFIANGIDPKTAEAMGKWVKHYVDSRLLDLTNKLSKIKEILK